MSGAIQPGRSSVRAAAWRGVMAAWLLASLVTPALAQVGQSEGVNDSYKALDVAEWVRRFEGEGREAFDFRREGAE